jgi:hypothetical protein
MKKVIVCLMVLILVLTGCGPLRARLGAGPFSRRVANSKVLYVSPVIVLEDKVATILCQGRPTEIRIWSANNKVLGRIPVGEVHPTSDGWVATFQLFDGLSAYFKPGDTYKVDCAGVNGSAGEPMSFRVYYFWSQAEDDGFESPGN